MAGEAGSCSGVGYLKDVGEQIQKASVQVRNGGSLSTQRPRNPGYQLVLPTQQQINTASTLNYIFTKLNH